MKPQDRARLILDSGLDTTSKLLAIVLSDYMTTGDERVYPSQETLAGRCSLTDRSVRTLVAAGVDSGWLVPSGVVAHVKAWRIDWDRLPRTRKKLPPSSGGGSGNPEVASAEPGSSFRSRPEVASARSDQGSDQEATSSLKARARNPEVASAGSSFRVAGDSDSRNRDSESDASPWPTRLDPTAVATLTYPTTWAAVTAHPDGLDALPWQDGGATLLRAVMVATVTIDALRHTSERDLGFRRGLTGGIAGELCRWLRRWGLVVGDLAVVAAESVNGHRTAEPAERSVAEVLAEHRRKQAAEKQAGGRP